MSTSISIKELKELDPSSYQIVDIRDAVEISHGAIPGALVMKTEEIETSDAIDRSKKTIICCSRGRFSVAATEELQEKGWDAVSLEGGYIAWLMDVMSAPEEQDKAADVEKSLRKKFKKSIWSKFTKAINTYELVKPGDRIAVCISGGKDSMLMAKCFQELKLHNKFDFEVKFVVMDPGYSPENRKVIEDNAKSLHIPITISRQTFSIRSTMWKIPRVISARECAAAICIILHSSSAATRLHSAIITMMSSRRSSWECSTVRRCRR